MTATARLLEQRSVGHVHLRMERAGIAVMREAGSAKCRVPRGGTEAILINTSGGLAGGDAVSIRAEVAEGARLTLTTQAAERIYRTLGPDAEVRISLKADRDATLFWLPQESIFFEGSSLNRSLDVQLGGNAVFLAVEPMVFGRHEMGERINKISVRDTWKVFQGGKLLHAEAFAVRPDWPHSKAAFAENHAAATVLMIAPDSEQLCEKVRRALGPDDGASAWNGKLVARLIAKDGFHLRKTLIRVFSACLGQAQLPKCWTF